MKVNVIFFKLILLVGIQYTLVYKSQSMEMDTSGYKEVLDPNDNSCYRQITNTQEKITQRSIKTILNKKKELPENKSIAEVKKLLSFSLAYFKALLTNNQNQITKILMESQDYILSFKMPYWTREILTHEKIIQIFDVLDRRVYIGPGNSDALCKVQYHPNTKNGTATKVFLGLNEILRENFQHLSITHDTMSILLHHLDPSSAFNLGQTCKMAKNLYNQQQKKTLKSIIMNIENNNSQAAIDNFHQFRNTIGPKGLQLILIKSCEHNNLKMLEELFKNNQEILKQMPQTFLISLMKSARKTKAFESEKFIFRLLQSP